MADRVNSRLEVWQLNGAELNTSCRILRIPEQAAHDFRNDAAHPFRDNAAHRSEMMSPTIPG